MRGINFYLWYLGNNMHYRNMEKIIIKGGEQQSEKLVSFIPGYRDGIFQYKSANNKP